jgi:hypothetical protein
MNKISFKGSNEIIRDIVSRFLAVDDESAQPSGPGRSRYARALGEIAAARSVEKHVLTILLDFLMAHGVTEERLDQLTGERVGELVRLALDAEILGRYRRDGTITDVRVVDEWPF